MPQLTSGQRVVAPVKTLNATLSVKRVRGHPACRSAAWIAELVRSRLLRTRSGDARPGTPAEGRSHRRRHGSTASRRGRYATDASHYQIMPVGVVAPRTIEEAERAIAIAREEGVTRAAARRRHLAGRADGRTIRSSSTARNISTRILELDVAGRRCAVEPGIVLDELNRAAQAARAVVPGRYLDRVARHHRRHGRQQFLRRALAALRQRRARTCSRSTRVLADGTQRAFRAGRGRPVRRAGEFAAAPLARDLLAHRRARGRRDRGALSEGAAPGRRLQSRCARCRARTTSISRTSWSAPRARSRSRPAIELKLSPLLGRRAVGACHFGSFHEAMEAAQHIVKLGPIAVELVDRTMIGLARDIAMFRPTIEAFVRGEPEAILLVEFAEDDQDENVRRLKRLQRADGRSRLRLGQAAARNGAAWSRCSIRSCRPRSPRCAPPASTS